jgi:hypothetical protein
MKGFRAHADRPVAIVVSIIALLFALGGGAYASARNVARPPLVVTTVTEHTLTLLNGWQSANSTSGTGKPKFAVSGGVVYLSGSLMAPNPSSNEFAKLPAGARPGHILYLPIYTSQGAGGTVQIFPGGVMAVFSNNPVSAHDFSSLAGISFPVGS